MQIIAVMISTGNTMPIQFSVSEIFASKKMFLTICISFSDPASVEFLARTIDNFRVSIKRVVVALESIF